MTTYRFQATPLTPIHIGNGDVLSPEDYLIQGEQLVRFNRTAVIRDMPEPQRQQLESALDKNNFVAAQEIVRAAVDNQRHGLSCISIGDESRAELDQLVRHPQRACHVHPFVANSITSRAFLPGSSLKGAIRTALVNCFTQKHLSDILPQVTAVKKKEQYRALESAALNFQTRRLEGDPLRLLKVADAELPAGCTRIDRVLHWKKGGSGQEGKIQLHYERLLCQGDGDDIHFPVDIKLDEMVINHSEASRLLGRSLTIEFIRNACNTFYWGRMNAELERFFPEDDPQTKSIYRRVKVGLAVRNSQGQLRLAPPPWHDRLLLRVGRFSQFESLSVDKLRGLWDRRLKREIQEGSSRTLCRCRKGSEGAALPLPFGWLLLKPEL